MIFSTLCWVLQTGIFFPVLDMPYEKRVNEQRIENEELWIMKYHALERRGCITIQ
jgi:hypothetical protein